MFAHKSDISEIFTRQSSLRDKGVCPIKHFYTAALSHKVLCIINPRITWPDKVLRPLKNWECKKVLGGIKGAKNTWRGKVLDGIKGTPIIWQITLSDKVLCPGQLGAQSGLTNPSGHTNVVIPIKVVRPKWFGMVPAIRAHGFLFPRYAGDYRKLFRPWYSGF